MNALGVVLIILGMLWILLANLSSRATLNNMDWLYWNKNPIGLSTERAASRSYMFGALLIAVGLLILF